MFKSKVGFVFPMTGPPKGLSETPEEMAEDDLILEKEQCFQHLKIVSLAVMLQVW